ncbi:MAG: integrase core domain-containing protein, partial [Phycisphaerae bacterium]
FYVFFAMRVCTRRVRILGVTPNPHRLFMKQQALELAAFDDSLLRGCTHLIIDRDTKYTDEFREILKAEGIEPVLIPPSAPNCNTYAERFVRSIRNESLDRLILFGESALRRTLREYERHFLAERNHQGLENKLIEPECGLQIRTGAVKCRERLGGLLCYYFRDAA